MSGPKSSRYTLTPEQRRLLEEQRKLEQRRAVATEQIKRTQKRLLEIGGLFRKDQEIARELLVRTGSDQGMSGLLGKLDTVLGPAQPLVANTDFGDVNSVESTAAQMKEQLSKAEKIAEKIAAVAARNKVILKADLEAAIDAGFSTSFADLKEVADPSAARKADALDKLGELKKIRALPRDIAAEIDEAMQKVEAVDNEIFLKNLIALTVNPLIRKVRSCMACRDEFEQLYAEYTALCELYYYVAQEYPCCQASIDTLRSEIQRIQDAVAEDDEQAYISDCLDEVMAQMGYTVIGHREVTKKNGKRFRNELYTYGEGTAVNVTYASDGRIAMELGGLDDTDRLPDDRETAVLCESMERFCTDFPEIERRLLAKGVVLAQRISMLPPSAEYAQIINTADYQMTEAADKLQAEKRQKNTTRRKALRKR